MFLEHLFGHFRHNPGRPVVRMDYHTKIYARLQQASTLKTASPPAFLLQLVSLVGEQFHRWPWVSWALTAL